MAELPRMPVVVGSLLADTTHMSTEEFGAYCRILFTMWLHGGRVADDDHQLARIVGMTYRRWITIAGVVRKPLTSAGGELSQKRLTETWIEVQELRRTRAEAANKRWHGAARVQGMQQMQKHNSSNPILKSKIDSSESEYGTAREAPAPRPQGPPRAGSWQPEQNNRRKR